MIASVHELADGCFCNDVFLNLVVMLGKYNIVSGEWVREMSERDGGKPNKIGVRLNKQNSLDSSRA